MAAEWYYSSGGAQQGPVSLAEVKQLIQAGTLTRQTLIWKEGMSGWTPAGQVNEVFAAPTSLPSPATAPPPLPNRQRIQSSIPSQPPPIHRIPKGPGSSTGASRRTAFLLVGSLTVVFLISGLVVFGKKERRTGISGYSGTVWGMSPDQVEQATGYALSPLDAEYPPGTQPEL